MPVSVLDANAIANGTFDTLAGWQTSGDVKNDGVSIGTGLYSPPYGNVGTDASVSQHVDHLPAGSTLLLSANLMNNADTKRSIEVACDGRVVGTLDSRATSNAWTVTTLEFTSPADDFTLTLTARGGYMRVDDVRLVIKP
ncbi:hypothetical protein [Bifidobacterium tissieri]|uniref:hypothetical protein n=1 Tax=Bifidobacterium tissieri TaxID=1630162 RepID=UPI001239090E|nr:hypothetical protein [Bifidobacterium tissieri]KAA8832749.1 hypothetical protein EM849_02425 [Bifidobacterium tissieri]